jgi:hypothetical protein
MPVSSASGRSRRGFLYSPAGTPRFSKPAYAKRRKSAAAFQSVPGPGSVIDAGIGLWRNAKSAMRMNPISGTSLPRVKT